MSKMSLNSPAKLALAALTVTLLGASVAEARPGTARHRSANHAATQPTAPNLPQSGQTQNGAAATPRAPARVFDGVENDETHARAANPSAATAPHGTPTPKSIGGYDTHTSQ